MRQIEFIFRKINCTGLKNSTSVKIRFICFTINYSNYPIAMNKDIFLLTLNAYSIDRNTLQELKIVFKQNPGESKVNLRILDNNYSYKLIELKDIKVDINLQLMLATISII